MTGPVLCVGEAMVSLRSTGRLRLGDPLTSSVAGAESNVAIGLRRLGHRVCFGGAVGTDELGELVLRVLRAECVEVEHVRRDPHAATGVMFRELRGAGVVAVEYLRAGSAGSRLDGSQVLAALDATAPAHVHVSGVTAALSPTAAAAAATLLDTARERGIATSLDANYRSRLWSRADARATLRALARSADVVFASGDEVDLVLEQVPAPGTEVVVTHAERGAEAWAAGRHERVAARTVRVVDVVGAGDAFVAGYLSARLRGADLADRLAHGAAVAAVAVSSPGDWEGLPTQNELSVVLGDAADVVR